MPLQLLAYDVLTSRTSIECNSLCQSIVCPLTGSFNWFRSTLIMLRDEVKIETDYSRTAMGVHMKRNPTENFQTRALWDSIVSQFIC